ncbi:MAG: hypothetical protein WCK89_09415 [bacterium]
MFHQEEPKGTAKRASGATTIMSRDKKSMPCLISRIFFFHRLFIDQDEKTVETAFFDVV